MKKTFYNTILGLIVLCGVGCVASPNSNDDIVEITGTVRSSFENFSFTPDGSNENHWINYIDIENESYYAKNWGILDDIHQVLLKKEQELRAANQPTPIIYICVSGSGRIQSHENGVGHMGQWKSDITFTEIKSATIGKCENT